MVYNPQIVLWFRVVVGWPSVNRWFLLDLSDAERQSVRISGLWREVLLVKSHKWERPRKQTGSG